MRLLTALLLLSVISPALSQDKPATQPSDAAMMDEWQKKSLPGPAHAELKKMAGTFKSVTKFWFSPDQPPQTSEGTCTWTPIMDGRFMKQDFKGTAMGQPFTGMGIVGYDNMTGQYQSMWIDSMGTTMMFSQGKADPTGKTITFAGSMPDPMSGQVMKTREVSTSVSENEHKFEIYCDYGGGKEMKMMEILYTRVK